LKIEPSVAVQVLSQIDAIPTILEVICRTTGMGFAAVARVTEAQWIACAVRDDIAFGLKPGGELKVETTICDEIRQHRNPVVIDHVAEDSLYANHHTPVAYGLQSYISFPIVLADGSFFGTLCAVDPRPNRLNTPAVIGMFKLFSDLIAFHLDANHRVLVSENDLKTERQAGELREQFIAVLGHDLRNPLASIDAGATYLQRRIEDQKLSSVLSQIRGSVVRMSRLIDDVLDFARGRLGGGLSIDKTKAVALKPVLDQVIEEFRAAHPNSQIGADFADVSIPCDPVRIGQLLSNLVANALSHGAVNKPIKVKSTIVDGTFALSVANSGAPIPPDVAENLFQPFFRGSTRKSQQGLGLGLYIASEIAHAHGGTLAVTSSPEETEFTFRLPVA
jgi:signal transduction histidine kinase